MWKASFGQSSSVDLTIQCQLNMASRNTLEVSSVFASPANSCNNGNTFKPPCSKYSESSPADARFTGYTGVQPFTSCEFAKSQAQNCQVNENTCNVVGENSQSARSTLDHITPTFKQCSGNSYYNGDYLDLLTSVFDPVKRQSPPSYGLNLNDSGYDSPGLAGGQRQRSHTGTSPQFAPNHFRDSLSPVYPSCSQINDQRLYHPANYSTPEILPQLKENSAENVMTDSTNGAMKLAMRERDVSQRLYNLKCQESTSNAAFDIERVHHSYIASVDLERHNVLCQVTCNGVSAESVNKYYNMKLLSVLESTEEKLASLEKTIKCKSGKLQAKKGRMLPKKAVKIIETWYKENLANPYPSREVTLRMAKEGGITVEQIRKWFANKRNRSRNNKLKNLGEDTTNVSS